MKLTFVGEGTSPDREEAIEAPTAEGILNEWHKRWGVAGESPYDFRADIITWVGAPVDTLLTVDDEILDAVVEAAGPGNLLLERD